ncbi:MAG: sec-independent translocase [Propioniciclava sp.]|uniref:sec-independent translocase n=1 Tax=Propioniciclava sp. TaxID=2038686 RepID=UPI0039E30B38
MSMSEIIGLVILAIIVFGPEKLPELARKAARILAYLRRVGNDARGQLRKELGPEYDDIRLSDLNPKNLVARHLLSTEEVSDLRQIRDEAMAEGRIMKDALDEAAGVPDGGTAFSATVSAQDSPIVRFDPEAT